MCNKCHCLKIQFSLVPSGVRRELKRKVTLDMEEAAQPKWLRPIVEASGKRTEMQGEPSTREILMEQLELLMDSRELFVK